MPDQETFQGTAQEQTAPEVIYGRNAVAELLKAHPDRIAKIYFQINAHDKRLLEILITAKRNRISIGKASNQKLSDLARSNKHQGVVAIASDIRFLEVEDVLSVPRHKPFFLLILDSIEDPQNLGAIIRTAEAAGVDLIILPRDRSAPINSTVHKISAGAVSHAPIARVTNLAQTIRLLKDRGIWVVGTDADAPRLYTDFDYTMNVALVIGSEGKGMRRLVHESCDEVVRVPMFGKTDSLNASVAAGILLYEVVRQRQAHLPMTKADAER
ncbi:MAG: 23S rRNA (guanosine(2251)-2'-O)-methyltransferase RlmB [Chloroherpetonaceae bacterium]|nr:23S rRNA (guanosine(2251)-2'-O)-methyltransferase RlmB [Chloroherpetonaceae bacterium]MCS7210883.1 23S rRNA (guanosine(2251)-2'-O)-methyltransferase RlmB [Chloroherpetonaceae bacterium]MDW8019182.1 23S rRNA (guanosine(2251)-2'-O)-methyltransferase RlmB [Chloroherpetonaceae bacterium]MDW8465652.1 23S rRNA (guanosine(2251)-2'-O)-methyltransferase RlmB [Chloroherpetonaceae bacterium]